MNIANQHKIFVKAEACQAKAFKMQEAGLFEDAHFAHLKAESLFLKIGDVSRASESEFAALSCIQNA